MAVCGNTVVAGVPTDFVGGNGNQGSPTCFVKLDSRTLDTTINQAPGQADPTGVSPISAAAFSVSR